MLGDMQTAAVDHFGVFFQLINFIITKPTMFLCYFEQLLHQLAIQIIHANRVITATGSSVGDLDFFLKFSIVSGMMQFVVHVSQKPVGTPTCTCT